MFNPQYKITNKMVNMLTAIAEAKGVVARAKLLPKHELRLRRQALVRMTHSSTAIEGNMLNLHQVEFLVAGRKDKIDAPARDVFEVVNYLAAIRYIQKVVEKKQVITRKVILKIHSLVTRNTLPEKQSGHYRQRPVYVVRRKFGQPNKIIYTGPTADTVEELMNDLIVWIQKSQKNAIHPILVAGIVHQEIAAIHPFSDGNGRTARAVATLILYKRGYDFKRLFALEDYYNKDRQKYYTAINIGRNYQERKVDFTPWLEYFVKGFKEEIDNVKEKIVVLQLKKVDKKIRSQIYLDKDQMKILDFLDTVGKITTKDVMDILLCPKRTAQFHLQKLKRLGMIKQVGKARAATYLMS